MESRTRIRNPYDATQNGCFGCSVSNPIGLKLTFEESEHFLHAVWEPSPEYQGYKNVLHGGIIATLLDEIGAWCVSVKAGTSGVTSSLTVKYLKPAYISKGSFTLDAEITSREGSITRLRCRLFDGDGIQCAEAEMDYYLYPLHVAHKRYHYPGKDAFYFKEASNT